MVFNILCGNTDDHARNHAALWDGQSLSLTPAYDVCPQPRTGGEASQAMLIHGDNRMSQLSVCLEAAPNFLLDTEAARGIIEQQIRVIGEGWKSVCDEAQLAEADRQLFWRRQFLNPFAFFGAPAELSAD
jgi:serine/threonine-protein kinase HipA